MLPPGGVHFDRHRDGVLVVFDHEQHRQLEVRCRVERLPELALAGRAVAAGDVHDFVAVEDDVFELTIVTVDLLGGFGMLAEIASGFGASHGLQKLRSRWETSR